jgi:ABC-type branched-subunit amino acid transport system ATPase component
MNPFRHEEPVIPPIFSGRIKELSELKKHVIKNNKSVSISGFSGVGKSSLIKSFFHELENGKERFFPVSITESQLYSYIEGDFLNVLTHEICANIWIRVLGGTFSELLEGTLMFSQSSPLENKHKTLIKRIFRIVTNQNFNSKGTRGANVSGKLLIGGELKESNELSMARKPLAQFEFLMLLDELMEVLSDHSYKKIIISCDQLNHLPPQANYDLVSQNIDVLSSKKIIFLVSSVNEESKITSELSGSISELFNSFAKEIKLSGFLEANEIKEYVTNSLNDSEQKKVIFEDDCFEFAFHICEGYPWFISKMFEVTYQDCIDAKVDNISSKHFDKYGVLFTKVMNRFHNTIASNMQGKAFLADAFYLEGKKNGFDFLRFL